MAMMAAASRADCSPSSLQPQYGSVVAFSMGAAIESEHVDASVRGAFMLGHSEGAAFMEQSQELGGAPGS